jgi:hypothetical protein
MPKSPKASFTDFIDGWSAKDMLRAWRRHLRDFGIQLEPCVQIISTKHHFYGPVFRTTWWRRDEYEKRLELFHRLTEETDRGFLPDHAWSGEGKSGAEDTARVLRRVRRDPDAIGAVLIAASLFPRNGGHRRPAPNDWPDKSFVDHLWKWTRPRFSDSWTWPPQCTSTLPVHGDFNAGARYTRLDGFIEALAVEHARVLLNFIPISVETDGHNPFEDDYLYLDPDHSAEVIQRRPRAGQ